jgi:hypothetical protein
MIAKYNCNTAVTVSNWTFYILMPVKDLGF